MLKSPFSPPTIWKYRPGSIRFSIRPWTWEPSVQRSVNSTRDDFIKNSFVNYIHNLLSQVMSTSMSINLSLYVIQTFSEQKNHNASRTKSLVWKTTLFSFRNHPILCAEQVGRTRRGHTSVLFLGVWRVVRAYTVNPAALDEHVSIIYLRIWNRKDTNVTIANDLKKIKSMYVCTL